MFEELAVRQGAINYPNIYNDAYSIDALPYDGIPTNVYTISVQIEITALRTAIYYATVTELLTSN